jgi:hypothetical protein
MGFEDIVFHIERGDLLDILAHPNPDRYAGQRIFVVRRDDYVYLVPFVEDVRDGRRCAHYDLEFQVLLQFLAAGHRDWRGGRRRQSRHRSGSDMAAADRDTLSP